MIDRLADMFIGTCLLPILTSWTSRRLIACAADYVTLVDTHLSIR